MQERCRDLLLEDLGPLVVPSPVLTEVCWLLESRMGFEAEAAFVESMAAGKLYLAELTVRHVQRMAELVRRYGDFPFGAADASAIAVAERLNTVRLRYVGPPPLPGHGARARRLVQAASVKLGGPTGS